MTEYEKRETFHFFHHLIVAINILNEIYCQLKFPQIKPFQINLSNEINV